MLRQEARTFVRGTLCAPDQEAWMKGMVERREKKRCCDAKTNGEEEEGRGEEGGN